MKTKGAKSHSFVTLAELNKKLNQNEEVMVSRRWAREKNLETAKRRDSSGGKTDGEISVQFVN